MKNLIAMKVINYFNENKIVLPYKKNILETAKDIINHIDKDYFAQIGLSNDNDIMCMILSLFYSDQCTVYLTEKGSPLSFVAPIEAFSQEEMDNVKNNYPEYPRRFTVFTGLYPDVSDINYIGREYQFPQISEKIIQFDSMFEHTNDKDETILFGHFYIPQNTYYFGLLRDLTSYFNNIGAFTKLFLLSNAKHIEDFFRYVSLDANISFVQDKTHIILNKEEEIRVFALDKLAKAGMKRIQVLHRIAKKLDKERNVPFPVDDKIDSDYLDEYSRHDYNFLYHHKLKSLGTFEYGFSRIFANFHFFLFFKYMPEFLNRYTNPKYEKYILALTESIEMINGLRNTSDSPFDQNGAIDIEVYNKTTVVNEKNKEIYHKYFTEEQSIYGGKYTKYARFVEAYFEFEAFIEHFKEQ